jgi:thioredoxin reductase (NADPH)
VLNQCPELSDIILQAFIARRQLLRESGAFTGLRVIGSRYSKDTFRIRDFLAKNRILFSWLDLEADAEVDKLLHAFGVTEADTPIVACADRVILRNPSNRQLAEFAGIHRPLDQPLYDLAIVGAGPAGLAAAVYGASEGLSTVVVDRVAPGGQAGSSMRIENYLGFPTGITGAELADRATLQADKFGARLSVATNLTGLMFEERVASLSFDGGETITAKCLLIATGADYQRLQVEGCDRFEGCGVYYAATPNELVFCRGGDGVVVGGGNSAGQAAVFLSGQLRRVYLVIRDSNIERKMSTYLARRILQTPNIEVLCNCTIERMMGDGQLRAVDVLDRTTNQRRTLELAALFSFIGARPHTHWLPPDIETDGHGFILTGQARERSLPDAHAVGHATSAAGASTWNRKRQPFLLETSRPGVFAAGDVRAGSIKRVASAVGEGSMAVQFVHEYLKEM